MKFLKAKFPTTFNEAHDLILKLTGLILLIILCTTIVVREFCRSGGEPLFPRFCNCVETGGDQKLAKR